MDPEKEFGGCIVTNIISIKNLKKEYKDGTQALKGICIDVPKGVCYGLLGENGAGKSTLISIITTALGKTEGEVYVNGHSLDTDADKIRESIGVVFQESVSESGLTGNEILINHGILYGMRKDKIKEKVTPYLQKLGLEGVADKFIETYSGGMRRKLEIVKGILTDPNILFLDEPTLGLDPQSRKQIWQFLNEMKENGLTIFVTSHYMDEIEQNADYVAIISAGKLVSQGEPSKIIADFNKSEGLNASNLEAVFIYMTERAKDGVV